MHKRNIGLSLLGMAAAAAMAGFAPGAAAASQLAFSRSASARRLEENARGTPHFRKSGPGRRWRRGGKPRGFIRTNAYEAQIRFGTPVKWGADDKGNAAWVPAPELMHAHARRRWLGAK